MSTTSVTITLNAPLRPLDRGDIFEDPLMEALESAPDGIGGEITGAGTELGEHGGPRRADIGLELTGDRAKAVAYVLETLHKLGAPKGSTVRVEDDEPVTVGFMEGVGLYLNGTDLPAETYANNDINELIGRLQEVLGTEGGLLSYWEGPTETALYFFGPSAERVKALIEPVTQAHPLAGRARLVLI